MRPPPFRGRLPADLLYDTGWDMWVRRDGDQVVIGATAFGIHLAGRILAFTAKPRGAEVEAGRGLGTVECAKTVIAVHAPLSFVLTEANEALEENPAPLNSDPYDAGWMVRGMPVDWRADVARLVDVAAYRAHVLAIDPEADIA